MKPAALLALSFLGTMVIGLLSAQVEKQQVLSSQELTSKRLHERGWWPTKGDAARKDYVGSEVCANCHAAEGQEKTSMFRAASRSLDSRIVLPNGRLSLNQPPFQTTIARHKKESSYTTSRGGEAMTGQIEWTMGDGEMGRTFIVQSNGSLFESQLSFYTSIAALDLTPGHLVAPPGDVGHAFGEHQTPETAQRCFACHTTASSVHGQFDPDNATPGIGCEVCHGPGAKHVSAIAQNRTEEAKKSILNPVDFDPVKLVDYCGACHRAPLDVVAEKHFVPINIRFQPYRLAKSRCWSKPDARLTCIACHNPHQQITRDPLSYDAKCLACHAVKGAVSKNASSAASPVAEQTQGKLASCPVSSDRCVSCHMPKYKVPQMHGSFTDHDIRVVREGVPYPI